MLALLLVALLPLVPERVIPGGGVLHTLGSPSDPDSTGSSAGSKSVIGVKAWWQLQKQQRPMR